MRAVPLASSVMVAIATVFLSGCTWVHMAPGASSVRVLSAGAAPAGCERRGEITVSVKDRLGFYERNDLRVHEELETLARNEAPGLSADSIQPLAAPKDGEQRFAAWRCGVSAAAASGPAIEAAGNARTYPIGG